MVALVVHVTPQSTPVPPSTTTWRTVSRARWPGSAPGSVRLPGPCVPPHPTASADAAEGAAGCHADGGGMAPTSLVCGRADCLWRPAAGHPGLCGPESAVQVSLGSMARHSMARHSEQGQGLTAAFCSSRSNRDRGKLLLGKRWVLRGRGRWICGEGQPCALAQAPIVSLQAAGRCSVWGVFNVPHVWLWSLACCARKPSLPRGEGAALTGAMGADMAIWPGDSHVDGRAGAETLRWAG